MINWALLHIKLTVWLSSYTFTPGFLGSAMKLDLLRFSRRSVLSYISFRIPLICRCQNGLKPRISLLQTHLVLLLSSCCWFWPLTFSLQTLTFLDFVLFVFRHRRHLWCIRSIAKVFLSQLWVFFIDFIHPVEENVNHHVNYFILLCIPSVSKCLFFMSLQLVIFYLPACPYCLLKILYYVSFLHIVCYILSPSREFYLSFSFFLSLFFMERSSSPVSLDLPLSYSTLKFSSYLYYHIC